MDLVTIHKPFLRSKNPLSKTLHSNSVVKQVVSLLLWKYTLFSFIILRHPEFMYTQSKIKIAKGSVEISYPSFLPK